MKKSGNFLLTILYLLFVICSCSLEIRDMMDDIPSVEIDNNSSQIVDVNIANSNHFIPVNNVIKEDNTYFNIEFIDVGQGDAILVSCNNHYMIVDGGDKYASDLMYSLLMNKNISYIDYIFASHADADHIGGLSGVLNYCIKNNVKVGNIYCNDSNDTDEYNDFIKYSGVLGNNINKVSDGDTLYLKDAKIEVLSCNVSSDNDSSIVLLLTYGDNKILLTGDGQSLTENYLINNKNIEADILKVSHHGSKSSTSEEFLKTVNPKYAVISVGNNNYGHPSDEVINLLKNNNITIYRTDYNGDIVCESDRENIACKIEKNDEYKILAKQNKEANKNTVEQSEFKYILNIRTDKFHYPSCKSVDLMKEENKEYSNQTREEIIAMGYDPCMNCNP